jgi:hypothetical protein
MRLKVFEQLLRPGVNLVAILQLEVPSGHGVILSQAKASDRSVAHPQRLDGLCRPLVYLVLSREPVAHATL